MQETPVRSLGQEDPHPHPPRGGNGNPLQDSCHRNPIDRGAWRATDHGLAKSQTRLSGWLAAGCCPAWTERHPQAPRPLWTPRACRIAPVWSCEHKEKKHSILVLGNVAFIRGKLTDEILRTQDRPKTAVQPQGGDVLGDRGHAGLNHKGVLLLFDHLTAHRSYAFTITYNFILDPFRERSVIMTKLRQSCDIFVNTVAVESLSCVRPFVTPWTAARQASLSITNSRSLLKLRSIESVMPSNHFILCRPLLLLPSIFPSIRVFPMSQFFPSGGQSIGASASASVLPMNIQN